VPHPEQQVVAVVMNAVPLEYRQGMATELRSKGRALTLDEIEDCLEHTNDRCTHTMRRAKNRTGR
jgi:hypothetical protein